MDDSIKTLVDIASAMFEKRLNSDETDRNNKATIHLVECDLVDFMVYLAMSDGVATQDEADEISLMSEKSGLDIEADSDVIAWHAKVGNILSTEFEKKVPFTFEDAVEHDNYTMGKKGGSEATQLSKFLLAVYKILGRWFIEMDGESSAGERANYSTYIKTLEDYFEANYIVDDDEDEDMDDEDEDMDDEDEDMDDEDEDMDDEDEDMDDEDEDMDDEDEDMDDDDADTDDADDVAELNVDMAEDYIREILARKPARRGVEAPRKG